MKEQVTKTSSVEARATTTRAKNKHKVPSSMLNQFSFDETKLG